MKRCAAPALGRDGRRGSPAPFRPGHPAYPWWVLVATSPGVLMSLLDSTVVNVAVARLQTSFGVSTDAVQWVITAYLLSFTLVLVASGWLAERFGTRQVFLGALALFTFGSLLCSLSWSLPLLVLSRVIQGAGGGLLGSISMAIVRREFPKEKLGLGIAVWSLPALASTSFGPTLGGWILGALPWQVIFSINIPFGLIGLALSSRILRDEPQNMARRFDPVGFVAAAVALSALLIALADGNAAWNTDGWRSGFILGWFGVSAAALVLFFWCQATTNDPILDFSLFRSLDFSIVSVVLFVFGLGMFGSDFLLPLYLQVGLGYSPLQAGIVFIPFGVLMVATGPIGGRLTDRLGPKIPAVIGILLRSYGMYRASFLTPESGTGEVIGVVAFLAAGMGLLMSPLQAAMLGPLPNEKVAQATGFMGIMQRLGGVFGVAVLSTILSHRESVHLALTGAAMSASSPVFSQVLSHLTVHALATTGGTLADASARAEALVMDTVQTHAFVSAVDDSYLVTTVVGVVSSIPFLFIRSKSVGSDSIDRAPLRPAERAVE